MYTLQTLKNNIKLITAPLHETQAVAVLILVKVGSRYESARLNGVSHFIEHLLFKGTKKRPTSLHITKELDGVGADYNAFTAKDHTGYYIKVNKEHLELCLDILSDILFNTVFEPKEIEREKGVIIEEINMFEDNPLLLIGDVFEQAVYGRHPLGRRISGSKENIKNIKRSDIVRFFKKCYLNKELIVGIAGNFDQSRIKELVQKYFGRKKIGLKSRSFKKFSSRQKELRINLHYQETQQAQIALGFPAFKNIDPRAYPLMLLAVVLGGGMSSRLFIKIREKLGLAYFIRAAVNLYEDTGSLVIQAGLNPVKTEKAVKTILFELQRIKEEGVSLTELKRAKEFLNGRLILSLEDSASLISWFCEQKILTGKIDSLEKKLKKVKAVTLADVKKVAGQIIDFRKLNLGLIGPFKEKEKFVGYLKDL